MEQFIATLLANPITLGLVIVLGFVILLLGAEGLVDGASSLAKRLGVSDLMIGLTIVAFGTSMPEFVVNMFSVANNATDLAITNILGSNIINTLVILGCSALVYPIAVQRNTIRFELPMNILAGALVFLFVYLTAATATARTLSRLEGMALLLVFAGFLFYSINTAKDDAQTTTSATFPIWKCIVFIVLGLAGLVLGGEMIVRGATTVAQRLGIAESVIGLTVVALGTSLPELATSVIAAFKRNSDIAIGNVVGSNIFNVFFILGTSAVIRPLPIYDGIVLDSIMVTLSAGLVWLGAASNKALQLKRWHGAVLLIVYAAYLTYRLMN